MVAINGLGGGLHFPSKGLLSLSASISLFIYDMFSPFPMLLFVYPSVCLSLWLTVWLNVCVCTHLSDNIHKKVSSFLSNSLLSHQYEFVALCSLHVYPMHFLYYPFLDIPAFHCNCRSAFPPCESCRIAPRLFRWLMLFCSAFALHSFCIHSVSLSLQFALHLSWNHGSQQFLIYVCLCVYVYGYGCVSVCTYIQVHTHQWWIKIEGRRVWFSPPHPPSPS